MRNFPLPLKYNINYEEDVSLRGDSSSFSSSTWEEYNTINVERVLNIVYPKLTLAEALTVETELLATKGTERLLLNGKKYLIKDGYESIIGNTYVTIKLSIIDVTGGLL